MLFAGGRKGDLSQKQTSLTPQNRCVTQSVTNCMPTLSIGTIVNGNQTAFDVLFNHHGTDAADCDVSDRA
ncbi:hypothetical protein, partial [Pseudomonas syringae group genomosp. 3]|uniref:hypothetical protein n=1 Tax=Pseudomonas syringae group genomosp. 3 TaxID=251701 RepID=UPI001C3F2439